MTRPEFVDLMTSLGISITTAETAWQNWTAELSNMTVEEFDSAMRSVVSFQRRMGTAFDRGGIN